MERAASLYARKTILDSLHNSGAVDNDVPDVAICFVGARVHVGDSNVAGCLTAVFVQINDRDARCTGAWRKLGHKQSHGSGTVNQVVLTHLAWQDVVAADSAGEGLDECGLVEVGLWLELVNVGCWRRELFC